MSAVYSCVNWVESKQCKLSNKMSYRQRPTDNTMDTANAPKVLDIAFNYARIMSNTFVETLRISVPVILTVNGSKWQNISTVSPTYRIQCPVGDVDADAVYENILPQRLLDAIRQTCRSTKRLDSRSTEYRKRRCRNELSFRPAVRDRSRSRPAAISLTEVVRRELIAVQ